MARGSDAPSLNCSHQRAFARSDSILGTTSRESNKNLHNRTVLVPISPCCSAPGAGGRQCGDSTLYSPTHEQGGTRPRTRQNQQFRNGASTPRSSRSDTHRGRVSCILLTPNAAISGPRRCAWTMPSCQDKPYKQDFGHLETPMCPRLSTGSASAGCAVPALQPWLHSVARLGRRADAPQPRRPS